MGEATVKVKVSAVLPYRNGRHVRHHAGDVVPLHKLTEAIVRRSSDRLLRHVLEPA